MNNLLKGIELDIMKANMDTKKTVVCYGEVLWDVFPTQSKPGGAPMNVAYHLHNFGIDSRMISRVGADQPGDKLLKLLRGWEIPTENCQIDQNHETGIVKATADENNEMSYIIQQPVAWDFISSNEAIESLVRDADAFVFGSLIARNETSRDTLYRLLEVASFKVFDINMRPPFYSLALIEFLLGKCDLLKLNDSELQFISSWFTDRFTTEEESVRFIQSKFKINEVIVTKGSEGASYYTLTESYSYPAFHVEVKDTVGSGDAFLAAFLAKRMQHETPQTALKYATALGAIVATHDGACPAYNMAAIDDFIKSKQLQNN